MISEGSCDTEDWSNYAENSVLYHRNKLLVKMYFLYSVDFYLYSYLYSVNL